MNQEPQLPPQSDSDVPPVEASPADVPSSSEEIPAGQKAPRIYTRFVIGALIVALLYLLLQMTWGGGDADSWSFYLAALICGVGTILGMKIIQSTIKQEGKAESPPGFLAWAGFPMMLFCLLAMLPLLIMAISPGAREWLTPEDQVVVKYYREPAEYLEIRFSRSVFTPEDESPTINLILNKTPITESILKSNKEAFTWSSDAIDGDNRKLSINMTSLRKALPDLKELKDLQVNAIVDAPQMMDFTKKRFLQRRIEIR